MRSSRTRGATLLSVVLLAVAVSGCASTGPDPTTVTRLKCLGFKEAYTPMIWTDAELDALSSASHPEQEPQPNSKYP